MLSTKRLNAYRIMWLFVFFDLPTETILERKIHAKFRKDLLRDGFTRFQLSIYMRHCPSTENADVHLRRVKGKLPEKGYVGILRITDKQFGDMELYYGKKETIAPKPAVVQLQMF